MAENVTVFGDIADKFDSLVAYDERLLDRWVEEEGYSTQSMVLASTAKAFMTFAKGFVDVGRLGNGILIEGGWKGAGLDVLRALNLAGGAGAFIGRGARLLRAAQGAGQATCAWVAQLNAIRLSGQRFFVTLEQFARRAGANLGQIAQAGRGANDYQNMVAALQAMRIPVRVLTQGVEMALDDLLNLVRSNPGGVITFTVRRMHEGQLRAHRLFATFSRLGGLVIRDPKWHFGIIRNLEELRRAVPGVVSGSPSEILFIPNALITNVAAAAETAGGLGGLALQLLPLIGVPAKDPETALQTVIVGEQAAEAKLPAQPPPPGAATGGFSGRGRWHGVVQGDWLSKIAKQHYGNAAKWPVLYAANRRTVGRDPNRLRPGQMLYVPELPPVRVVPAQSLPGVIGYV